MASAIRLFGEENGIMKISFKHSGTGDFKTVDTGWSWSLFIASGFLGLPLFFRGLALWGTVMMIAWCLSLVPLVVARPGSNLAILDWGLTIISLALCVYLGLKGNALTGKCYISLGYEFVNPNSVEARVASQSWGL